MSTSREPRTLFATLQLASWFGLVTGFAEVALLGVKKFYLGRAIWFGPEIAWMAPVANIAAFLLIGGVIWIVQRSGRPFSALTSQAFSVAALTFVSVMAVLLMYYPLHLYAKVLLAAGIGFQTGRVAERRAEQSFRLVRKTLPWMAATLLVGALLAVWRPFSARAGDAVRPPLTGSRPNVLLIVLDTVRAHNLSLYGYPRPTTPRLASWAESGVVFDAAMSTAPWTLPSHASMFTGRWPHELSATWETPLDDTHATLAEVLGRSGYATAGFVANTFYCGYEYGLSRGFQHYDDYGVSFRELLVSSTLVRSFANSRTTRRALGYYDNIPRKNAETITNDFLDWLPAAEGRPFFVFLNYFDAHEAYFPPAPFAKAFGPEAPRNNHLLDQDVRRSLRQDWPERPVSEIVAERNMYDAAIGYVDAELGRLFDEMAARNLLESTIVIVTSDHGEQFGEHGLFLHGNSLYQPLLRVPLIVRYPSAVPAGRRISSRVSLRDLAATVMDLTGITSTSPPFPGASLSRHWSAQSRSAAGDEPPVLAEVRRAEWGRDWYPTSRGDMASATDDTYHYIRNGDGREELYALDRDPGEQHDLSQDPAHRARLEQFRRQLARPTGKD